MNTPGYESLANVLHRAYGQAAHGKGAERHAAARPFTEQPMQSISELLGSADGLLYQAMKKIQESKRLDKDAGVRELLGAINYLAGAIIYLEADLAAPLTRLPSMDRFDDPPLPGKIRGGLTAYGPVLNPKQTAIAQANLAKQTKVAATWLCFHGAEESANPRDVPRDVPIGEACPVCFATSH